MLAIDYGKKRVGLALSDPLRILASPHGFLPRRYHKDPDATELIQKILELCDEQQVTEIVLGEPKRTDGKPHEWLDDVLAFGEKLREASGLPVHLVDERFTTRLAEETLRAQNRTRERKTEIDARAAAVILNDFLRRSES